MAIDLAEQNELLSIFLSQRLSPSSAQQLVQFIVHLEKHKGLRFVCNYLKSIRSYLLKGERTDQRIRTSKDGSLTGALKPLSRMLRTGRKGHIRVERILRVYGRYEAPKPTVSDYVKFAEQLGRPLQSDFRLKVRLSPREKYEGRRAGENARFVLDLPVSAAKKTPLVGKPERETLPFEHYKVLSDYAPGILIRNGDLFNLVYPLYHAEDETAVYSAADEAVVTVDHSPRRVMGENVGYPIEELTHDIVGSVVCLTKDRGYKLRFIANPHRLIQLALSRLKNAFERVLRRMPESSVYDQRSGTSWAQAKLLEGAKLWSVDLSAATDNFPFYLQESVARQMFSKSLEPDINLWRDVTHASWTTPLPYDPGNITGVRQQDYPVVRYGRGQAMGVAPSFSGFTVTHILLLRSLGGSPETFRVLGDDVLIADKTLYERYVAVLGLLEVPISFNKSLIESDVGEFAGRLVDRYGVWPVYKGSVRNMRSDTLGLVRQYGTRILRFLPKLGQFKKDLVRFFSSLPGYGFDHSLDIELLKQLNADQLVALYGEDRLDQLPLGSNVKITDYALAGIRPLSPCYEPGDVNLGFLGKLPQANYKPLVEHLNCNARDTSSLMDQVLRNSLSKACRITADLRNWEDKTSYSLTYYKRLFKRIKKLVVQPL